MYYTKILYLKIFTAKNIYYDFDLQGLMIKFSKSTFDYYYYFFFYKFKPGRLKHVQAIGWYLEEANMAQVSVNITDHDETPIHKVYEEVLKDAEVVKGFFHQDFNLIKK